MGVAQQCRLVAPWAMEKKDNRIDVEKVRSELGLPPPPPPEPTRTQFWFHGVRWMLMGALVGVNVQALVSADYAWRVKSLLFSWM